MSGSGDTTSTSSTASSDPKVQQTLDQLLGGVQDIWKQGPQVYGKSLYSPAGSTTQDAWSQGSNFANGLINSGGLNATQTNADHSLGRIGSAYGALGDNNGLTGAQSGAQGRLGNLYGAFGSLADNNGLTSGQSSDLSKLGGLSGQYGALSHAYDQNAPGYQALKDSITQNTLGSVNSMFGGEGRLGSGLNYQSAAKGLGDALAPLDYQNYQNSVNNKYQALNDQQGLYQGMFGDQQTGVGNQANAYGSQANLENSIFGNAQTGVGNQFNSLSGRTGIANQQFANGQTAIGNKYNALSTLGGIGNAQDANAQGILTGNANLWDAQHNGKLGLMSQLMSALNGGGQLGGTTTTQTQPGTPWWQTLFGLGIGGASLASKI